MNKILYIFILFIGILLIYLYNEPKCIILKNIKNN